MKASTTALIPAGSTTMDDLSPAFTDLARSLGYEGLTLSHQQDRLLRDLLNRVAGMVPGVQSYYDEDAGVFVSKSDEPDLLTTCLLLQAAKAARRLIDDIAPKHTPSLFNRFEALSEADAGDLVRRGVPSLCVRLADRSVGYILRSDVAFALGQMHLLAYPSDLQEYVRSSLRDMHACEGGPQLTDEEIDRELAERLDGVPLSTVLRTLVEELSQLDQDIGRHAPAIRAA